MCVGSYCRFFFEEGDLNWVTPSTGIPSVKLAESLHLKVDGWKIGFLLKDGFLGGANCLFQEGYLISYCVV